MRSSSLRYADMSRTKLDEANLSNAYLATDKNGKGIS
ncbi:pentapeptide repeat-containing protein [Mesobacillus foraminis]|nr:pentapeptide repeat-containing protein [Mesobacillus foraminis]